MYFFYLECFMRMGEDGTKSLDYAKGTMQLFIDRKKCTKTVRREM
jgi:hypothetical protein